MKYRIKSEHPSRPPMYLDVSCVYWVYSDFLAATFDLDEAKRRLANFKPSEHSHSIEPVP